ncbi:9317_t:CDS:1, partial [Acaulospora colombiana]
MSYWKGNETCADFALRRSLPVCLFDPFQPHPDICRLPATSTSPTTILSNTTSKCSATGLSADSNQESLFDCTDFGVPG